MRTALLLLAVPFLQGQETKPLPQFEVASIKPTPPNADFSVKIGVRIDGAQVSISSNSLADYVRVAYDVKNYQVITNTPWIESERWDIRARIGEGGKADQVRDMMKSLLADRFHLKFHRESKDFPVYALEVAKGGPKLKESVTGEDDPTAERGVAVGASGGPQGVTVNLGRGSYFTFADNKIEARKLSMVQLAEFLSRFMDRPVVDQSGLTGLYNIDMKMTDEDYNAMRIRSALSAGIQLPPQAMKLLELSSGDSIHAGLAALGLRLEAKKAPMDVIVIDSADRNPVEN
jgi:uncharacterized protein (TIGR03435 family)